MDDTLPARLAADLDGCFEELVRSYQDFVYGVALRMTLDRRDAEDVAQEAFVRAYKAMAGYDGVRIAAMRLRPWLARITVNIQRNRVRRRREATLEPAVVAALKAPAGEEPDARTEAKSRRDACRVLLDSLPEPYRLALVLRYVEGLPYAEVAEVLDRPVGTVKAQVHRGIGLLRESIERDGEGETWRDLGC